MEDDAFDTVQYYKSASPAFDPIQTVRKFFPETWIWQLSEVGLVN